MKSFSEFYKEETVTEAKTPKWSVSKQTWIDASKGYIEAQEDIIDELKALKDIKEVQKWIEQNNGDFEAVK